MKLDLQLLGNTQVASKGDNSQGEFYSVAITNNFQKADTGTKMIHLGKNTKSKIISKGSLLVMLIILIEAWCPFIQKPLVQKISLSATLY